MIPYISTFVNNFRVCFANIGSKNIGYLNYEENKNVFFAFYVLHIRAKYGTMKNEEFYYMCMEAPSEKCQKARSITKIGRRRDISKK